MYPGEEIGIESVGSKRERKVITMLERKRIDNLYQLLHRAEREGDVDSAAALKWAIFVLEQSYL